MEIIQETIDYREKFTEFFKSFQDRNGNFKYIDAIAQMASLGKTSLVIDFEDLMSYDANLAKELKERPEAVIQRANLAITDVMRTVNMSYAIKVKEFRARFRKLDEVIPLRALKASLINKLIMVEGIVTRTSFVKQLIKIAKFLENRKAKRNFWICTSRAVKEIAERMGLNEKIEEAGGKIIADTCMVVSPIEEIFERTGVNSAKAAHYLPSFCKQKVLFGRMEELI